MLLCCVFVDLCYYVMCVCWSVLLCCGSHQPYVFVCMCYYAMSCGIVDMTGSCPHNTESGFVVLVGHVSMLVLTHNHLLYWTFSQPTFHQLCVPNV